MVVNKTNKCNEFLVSTSSESDSSTSSRMQIKRARTSSEDPSTISTTLEFSQSATKVPIEIIYFDETKMQPTQQSSSISQTMQSSKSTKIGLGESGNEMPEVVKIKRQLENIKALINSIEAYTKENELDLELAMIELNLTQRLLFDGIGYCDFELLKALKVKLDIDLDDVEFIQSNINSSKAAQATLEQRQQGLKGRLKNLVLKH